MLELRQAGVHDGGLAICHKHLVDGPGAGAHNGHSVGPHIGPGHRGGQDTRPKVEAPLLLEAYPKCFQKAFSVTRVPPCCAPPSSGRGPSPS